MTKWVLKTRFRWPLRFLASCLVLIFSISTITPHAYVSAQTLLHLPAPGTFVITGTEFTPLLIRGITIHPEDPLRFDFLFSLGETPLSDEKFQEESKKMIKYFLASLTVPEKELWVNLSPYEKDRIIPDSFGKTEMGRDLLAQDYMLKQLTASLMHPEEELGQAFWKRVQAKTLALYGTTEIPMNTFNKIWILPQKAVVYEHARGAYVIECRLKVMLEEDYVALSYQKDSAESSTADNSEGIMSHVLSEIVRDVLIPEIEKEVNEGKIFANLRQIYHAMILATWYKQTLMESLLGKVYVDQNKTTGVDIDPAINQKIYDQYIEAFKKGVFNLIKEDYDPLKQEVIPRKYFSGGATAEGLGSAFNRDRSGDSAMLGRIPKERPHKEVGIHFQTVPIKNVNDSDRAMMAGGDSESGSSGINPAALDEVKTYSEDTLRERLSKIKNSDAQNKSLISALESEDMNGVINAIRTQIESLKSMRRLIFSDEKAKQKIEKLLTHKYPNTASAREDVARVMVFLDKDFGIYVHPHVKPIATPLTARVQIRNTRERFGAYNGEMYKKFLEINELGREEILRRMSDIESFIGRYRERESQPNEGYEEFITDGDLQRLVDALTAAGMGFVFEDGMTIARTQYPPNEFITNIAVFPLYSRNPAGQVFVLPEIILPDISLSEVGNRRYINAANSFLAPSMQFDPGDGVLIDFTDESHVHQKLIKALQRSVDAIKNRNLPLPNRDSAKRFVETLFFHEIGEMIFNLMDEARKEEWKKLLQKRESAVEPGILFFKNMVKVSMQRTANMESRRRGESAQLPDEFHVEMFADIFAMTFLPDNIYTASDEPNKPQWIAFMKDEVLPYLKRKNAKGENIWRIENVAKINKLEETGVIIDMDAAMITNNPLGPPDSKAVALLLASLKERVPSPKVTSRDDAYYLKRFGMFRFYWRNITDQEFRELYELFDVIDEVILKSGMGRDTSPQYYRDLITQAILTYFGVLINSTGDNTFRRSHEFSKKVFTKPRDALLLVPILRETIGVTPIFSLHLINSMLLEGMITISEVPSFAVSLGLISRSAKNATGQDYASTRLVQLYRVMLNMLNAKIIKPDQIAIIAPLLAEHQADSEVFLPIEYKLKQGMSLIDAVNSLRSMTEEELNSFIEEMSRRAYEHMWEQFRQRYSDSDQRNQSATQAPTSEQKVAVPFASIEELEAVLQQNDPEKKNTLLQTAVTLGKIHFQPDSLDSNQLEQTLQQLLGVKEFKVRSMYQTILAVHPDKNPERPEFADMIFKVIFPLVQRILENVDNNKLIVDQFFEGREGGKLKNLLREKARDVLTLIKELPQASSKDSAMLSMPPWPGEIPNDSPALNQYLTEENFFKISRAAQLLSTGITDVHRDPVDLDQGNLFLQKLETFIDGLDGTQRFVSAQEYANVRIGQPQKNWPFTKWRDYVRAIMFQVNKSHLVPNGWLVDLNIGQLEETSKTLSIKATQVFQYQFLEETGWEIIRAVVTDVSPDPKNPFIHELTPANYVAPYYQVFTRQSFTQEGITARLTGYRNMAPHMNFNQELLRDLLRQVSKKDHSKEFEQFANVEEWTHFQDDIAI